MIKYLAYIAIAYALLVLIVFILQRSLLYFPDKGTPDESYLASIGLKFWPTQSEFKGFTSTNPAAGIRGILIVFHGNAGSAWHRDYYVKALEPSGFKVILAEYPGYGGRSGKMNEQSFVDDAKGIITKIHTDYKVPVYLVGESMGCGIAAAAAADANMPVAGMVLITPWDSLPSLAQTHYWYLPSRLLVRDCYDSIKNLNSFNRPIAVVMADHDNVIPNRHTLKLYESIGGPKMLWRFKNAGHNTWPTDPKNPWWKEVMAFVVQHNPNVGDNTSRD